MKRRHEGEPLLTKGDTLFRSCTFEGQCLWKLAYDELVLTEKIAGRDYSHVPKFLGYICNSPDNIITRCPQ